VNSYRYKVHGVQHASTVRYKNLLLMKIVYVFLLLSNISSSLVYAKENDKDSVFLPAFRSGHNLSLLLSSEYMRWNTSQINLNNSFQENFNQPNNISSASEAKTTVSIIFRYAYHINIISSFGVFVGSSAGITASNGYYGIERNFYPGYGILFPTVLGGLVQNFGQEFRILSGIEYGAIWYPRMAINNQGYQEKELSAVPDTYAFFIGVDDFFQKNKALSLNLGYRRTNSPSLDQGNSSIFLNSLNITSAGYYIQFGVTWLLQGAILRN
jgi:hypothetical protein